MIRTIRVARPDCPTLRYAASELEKYIIRMTGCADSDAYDLRLGLLEDFQFDTSEVQDPTLDDVVDIRVQNGVGTIAGSNPRSVLQGVYIYLKSAGCLWVRPGLDGEYVPSRDLTSFCLNYHKLADYCFRGEVIEGSNTFENVEDVIRWFPKVGYNSFFLQYPTPFLYFRRYYEHQFDPKRDKTGQMPELYPLIEERMLDIEHLLADLDMIIMSVGHGWLFEHYGVHYKGQDLTYEISPALRQALAEVKGTRGWFNHSPSYTQLCMSNREAVEGGLDYLVDFLKKKPYVRFLALSMGDSANNHCECPNCRQTTPTDFYVRMLNRLDEKLTDAGISARIVIGFYNDTYWPPVKERLDHPERYFYKLALQRSYNTPITPDRYPGPLPEWKRNENHLKPSSELLFSFLDLWKPFLGNGRYMTFDYDLWTNQIFDPGQFDTARMLSADLHFIHEMNISGRFSCQPQRSAFPTALPNAIQGETLFDRTLDFDSYVDRFFEASFGADAALARAHLEKVTELFQPRQLRIRKSIVAQDTGADTGENPEINFIGNTAAQQRLTAVPDYIRSVLPMIEAHQNSGDLCRDTSWFLLKVHAEYCIRISRIYLLISLQKPLEAKAQFNETRDWLFSLENQIQPYFDVYLFCRAFKDFQFFPWDY